MKYPGPDVPSSSWVYTWPSRTAKFVSHATFWPVLFVLWGTWWPLVWLAIVAWPLEIGGRLWTTARLRCHPIAPLYELRRDMQQLTENDR